MAAVEGIEAAVLTVEVEHTQVWVVASVAGNNQQMQADWAGSQEVLE